MAGNEERLKIDMISEHASPLALPGGPDTGGQNVHVAALAVALARRGHEVRVFTRRDDADMPNTVSFAPGVSIEHVPVGPPQLIAKDRLLPYMGDFAIWLSRRWGNQPPDIVHAHFWMSGLAALEAARDRAVPVVQTFHALGSVKRRYQREADTSPASRVRMEGDICREAGAIIATCTDEVKELVEYGALPGQIFVVPCGVDTTVFRPDGAVSSVPNGRYRIITFGRLVPRKGIGTIIEALAQVPDTELVVAGGPARARLHDDAEARRLMRLARDNGVADRVAFAGQVAHDELPPLIRSADVAVSVPWYEPFGIAPVEAMACGVPVIVSAVGGHLDTVLDGGTGWHVPALNPDALAGRLRMLLADPEQRRALGRAAAERVRAHYTWSRVADATEAVYDRLVHNVAASAGTTDRA